MSPWETIRAGHITSGAANIQAAQRAVMRQQRCGCGMRNILRLAA
jgi:hypothetical protein